MKMVSRRISALLAIPTLLAAHSALCASSALAEPSAAAASDAAIHSYAVMVDDCTWNEAFQKARAHGGKLTAIESREEYRTVLDLLGSREAYSYYLYRIGARRDERKGSYFWVDENNQLTGTPINQADSWNQAEWMSGEPSFYDGDIEEAYVDLFWYDGENRWVWNDVPDDIAAAAPDYAYRLAYIMEYDYDALGESVDAAQALSSVPSEFFFSSGAGGWSTELTVYADGTFSGQFHDSDLGGGDGQYAGGICYISSFTGSFTDFRRISEDTYSMRLGTLTNLYADGTEWDDENGVHYIASEPYGIAGGDLFYLYRKGHPLATLPQGYLNWARMYMGAQEDGQERTALNIYGIYNVTEENGFGSYRD